MCRRRRIVRFGCGVGLVFLVSCGGEMGREIIKFFRIILRIVYYNYFKILKKKKN